MSVIQASAGGGGFWESMFPKALGLVGTALGGPIGGVVGNLTGNIASGQPIGASLIKSSTPLWNQDAWGKTMTDWRNQRGW